MKGYQLKITLKGTSPPVWRRIWIPAGMTFRNLHEAIQYLFGWIIIYTILKLPGSM